MARIQISNGPSGRIIATFPYDPLLVAKAKTIDGRRWHPVKKHYLSGGRFLAILPDVEYPHQVLIPPPKKEVYQHLVRM